MKRIALTLILWLAAYGAAFAQQNVQVIGAITPGDCPQFSSPTIVKDAGFSCNGAAGGTRQQLTGATNYYVNGSSVSTATCGPAGVSTCSIGSDSNNCLSPATACLTLQNVINILFAGVDFAGKVVNVYLAHNAGTTNYAAIIIGGAWVGTGVIVIAGDSTSRDATVIQDTNLGQGLLCKDLCTVEYDHVKFIDSPSTNAAAHISIGSTGNAGHLDLNDINLGAINTSGTQMVAGELGSIILNGPITISGGGGIAIEAAGSGFFSASNQTVTVSGTPTYSVAFAYLNDGGEMNVSTSTFSGSATGPRCVVSGSLNIEGWNPNAVFPGNADCVANSFHGAIGLQTGSGGSSSISYGTAGHALLSGGGASAKDTWDTAGVSCAANTVNLTTLVITNGIVTHC